MQTATDEVPGFRLHGLLDRGPGWRLHRALDAHRIRFDGSGNPVLVGMGTDEPLAACADDSAPDGRPPAPTARPGAGQRDLADLARLLDTSRAAPQRAAPQRAARPHRRPRPDIAPTNPQPAPAHRSSRSRDRFRRVSLALTAVALLATPVLIVLHALLHTTA